MVLTVLRKIQIKLKLLWEKINGLEFTFITPVSELDLDKALVHQGSSSCNKYLLRLFRSIDIKEGEAILDIGCAKGGAMYCMTRFPFVKIDGIEISTVLSDIAKKNFFKLKENRVTVINLNAISFNDYSKYDFLYLYNPFPGEVFNKVLLQIKDKLDQKKEIIIIYNNPVCHQQVIDGGFYKIKEFPDLYGNGIFLYSNFSKSKRLKNLL